MEQDISVLKQQINFNLRGEILFYELQNILKDDTEVFVRHKGLSKRNNSRDAIDLSSMLYQEDSRFTKEALVLHLAKKISLSKGIKKSKALFTVSLFSLTASTISLFEIVGLLTDKG